MAISQITNKSITDATITADDMAAGAVEGAMTTQLGRRNLIINGAMQVAQRGTSATDISGSFEYHTVDRFLNGSAGSLAVRYTISQSTDAPDGFSNSLKYECTTADDSQASNEYIRLDQRIEGLNLQGLAFGTSSAKTLTLSFWVKSSVTGQYSLSLHTSDGTDIRQRVVQYTINSANTWEQKVLTVEGDTDSGGTIRNTADYGLILFWGLRAGSTYNSTDDGGVWHDAVSAKRMYGQDAVVGANVGETWQITGVQLEVGDTATPFEHRSYGEELALCQRYYLSVGTSDLGYDATGYCASTTTFRAVFHFPVTMRDAPSSLDTTGTASDYGVQVNNATAVCSSVPTLNNSSSYSSGVDFPRTGMTQGHSGIVRIDVSQNGATLGWSAEL